MQAIIKLCPMCGSEPQIIFTDKVKGRCYLSCKNGNCRIETPICDSPEKCLEIWNKRVADEGKRAV